MNFVIVLTLCLSLSCASALNILAIFPYNGRSHFIVFRVLLHELARRGHNVTVINHFPEKNPPNNYHDISLAGSLQLVETEDVPLDVGYSGVAMTIMWLAMTGKETCDVMVANKQVQELVKKKQKFDVVLLEMFTSDCGLGIAHKLKAPVVATTSHILMPYHYDRFGIPSNPSFVSFHFLSGGTKPNFLQRVERVIFDAYSKIVYYWISQRNNQNALEKYFGEMPPLENLAREVKMLLLYQHFSLTSSKLQPANVVEIGGYHAAKAKPLTGALKNFVEEAEHGIIYISMGSVVKSSKLPKEKVQAILEAMNDFPQKFVWKWEDKNLNYDKNKVYIDSWLPQVDILAHPKTKAFFSHGGMGGTTEAITYGVPIVAMPILGDQPSNAAAIEESGYGVQLQFYELNKETLVAAFKKVLDPEFQKKAKAVAAAWKDRPLSPMDTAIYWIEYVAKHPSINYRTAAADVPFYQYYLLDILGLVLAIVFINGFMLYKVKKFCSGRKKVDQKVDQKTAQKKKAKRA